ncbi:MAG: type I glyceraldehyde-3-phosphate dehydrogenase [Anaerolineales bacterium]|nr:type I glyceraldehyde-3-phosphate dehydrogenase [Anaerolineales bacterium]
MARIAINGLGRIGRAALRLALEEDNLDLVAVNDIASPENIAYLIKYDTVYGRYGEDVRAEGDTLHVDKHNFKFFSEKDPAALPWKDLGVDIVIESTGRFTEKADAIKHIEAGAKYVIISAPTKSTDVPTVVFGVNTSNEDANIISCASCTTNSLTPVVEVIGRHLGIQKAIMTTVHGYTAGQGLVDGPGGKGGDFRRGRAAAANIVPATTGAAKATTLALPQYQGKFDGVALRVPVPVGSVSDIVMLTEKNTSAEEVNKILTEEANGRYKDIIRVTNDEIVSSDIVGDPHACIIDMEMTKVVDGNLVKIFAWYDNEWGYTNQMIRKAREIAGTLK